MGRAYMHGWISLPTMGEMLMEHGVPLAARVDGMDLVDVERLAEEIAEVSGFHVTVGRWQPVEEAESMEAALHVDAGEIVEVLHCLAQASAETFYDRYHKRIDAADTDFDEEAYARDFGMALDVCGLRWDQAAQPMLHDGYLRMLHEAADEIVAHPPM